jgi:hypothetical protein
LDAENCRVRRSGSTLSVLKANSKLDLKRLDQFGYDTWQRKTR